MRSREAHRRFLPWFKEALNAYNRAETFRNSGGKRMPKAKASLLVMMITAMTTAVLFWLPYTPRPAVRTVVVQEGSVIRTVLMNGAVIYRDQQPCICLQGGVVRRIHVRPGQLVKKGDLLFTMDTSSQEAALAAIQQMRYQQQKLNAADTVLSALAAEREWAWSENETRLRAEIQASQIRAGCDGVVENVYAEEGAYVSASGVLGSVRGCEKQIQATVPVVDAARLCAGTAAIVIREGQTIGTAVLHAISAPDAEGRQQLSFLPASEEQLARVEAGTQVTVETVVETIESCTPVPVSAVDEDGRVWYIEDGVAKSGKIPLDSCSAEEVAAPLEWAGRTIVLEPDLAVLTDGCAVKEAKEL